MCGKFTQMMSWGTLVTISDLLGQASGPVETVTPMRFATVVCLDAAGKRVAVRMRWGLVPVGTKNPRDVSMHIHARAETIDERPRFRDAFRSRRGLVVVRTFNEGRELTPSRTEQHVITPTNGEPLAIAVAYDRWADHNEGSLLTFAMVTVEANRLISTVTDRMPAVIAPEAWSKWLGEERVSIGEPKALLVPFEGDWQMAVEPRNKPQAKETDSQPTLF